MEGVHQDDRFLTLAVELVLDRDKIVPFLQFDRRVRGSNGFRQVLVHVSQHFEDNEASPRLSCREITRHGG
jgi:hypothetical protein